MERGFGPGWSVGFGMLMGLVAIADGIVAILNRSWILGTLSFGFLAVVIVQVMRGRCRNGERGPSNA